MRAQTPFTGTPRPISVPSNRGGYGTPVRAVNPTGPMRAQTPVSVTPRPQSVQSSSRYGSQVRLVSPTGASYPFVAINSHSITVVTCDGKRDLYLDSINSKNRRRRNSRKELEFRCIVCLDTTDFPNLSNQRNNNPTSLCSHNVSFFAIAYILRILLFLLFFVSVKHWLTPFPICSCTTSQERHRHCSNDL